MEKKRKSSRFRIDSRDHGFSAGLRPEQCVAQRFLGGDAFVPQPLVLPSSAISDTINGTSDLHAAVIEIVLA